jgi:hypothetical protein
MQRTMAALEKLFPGCAVVLLVAPFDAPVGSRVNYVGNGKREDVAVMMKELLARWEGRHQETPPGVKQ